MNKDKVKAIIQLVVTMLMVALVTVLAKKTLTQVTPFSFVWLQMLFGLITMSTYTFIIKKEKIPTGINIKIWLIVLLIGLCHFTLVRTLFIFSLDILPATTHAYLINFVGIVTMLFSCIFLREIPSKKQFFGALIAIFGIQLYFYVWPINVELVGLLYVIAAVFFLALTNILIRLLHLKFPKKISPNMIATMSIFFGGLPLIFYGLQSTQTLSNISLNHWLVIIANGIFSIAMAMSVFNLVIRQLRAYEASILASTGLIFTVIFSIPILDEWLQLHQLLGIIMLLIGIVLVQIKHKSIKV